MAQNVRDGIRSAIFASKNKGATRTFDFFGQAVEIRQPTLAQITRLSRVAAEDTKIPQVVRVLIEYCYVPETNEKVFDIGDAEQLASLPSGKWLANFNKAFEELSGIDVEAAEKNSEKTD